MMAFLVRRALLAALSLFSISIVTFAIVQMPPGDYADAYLERVYTRWVPLMSMETARQIKTALRKEWGLDRPLHMQYATWMGKVLRGEFGMSLVHNKPIKDVISDRMLMTVILALTTVMFTWVMAIPISIYSAVRQRSIGDYTFTFLGFVGLSTPDFLVRVFRNLVANGRAQPTFTSFWKLRTLSGNSPRLLRLVWATSAR